MIIFTLYLKNSRQNEADQVSTEIVAQAEFVREFCAATSFTTDV